MTALSRPQAGLQASGVYPHRRLSPSERALSTTQRMVLDCFESIDVLLTREDLAALTNLKLSSVCGRARELLDAGRLVKRGRRECIATGKSQELLGLPLPIKR
ncbi:hypothetical protein Bsp3421_002823 [Burkholderia sp. FERM BP-3421]|jgi:hypothetical protein|uniref:hypothetical protein n=1 Tax=Burkholderia sp. FERM BP-3421 TaxID=1494466 RepID=UPI002362197D|nr:hypothetical protein [Burkholderia sp. FERM BP-3421]WDD92794.1 hypothetical protein Bsp3421_002823 [Burkholderia sp. FERM BP-3421]